MPWLLIALAVAARFLPHPFNVTPLGGLGLFAGARLDPRLAWLVPLGALAVGDLVAGPYDPVVMLAVYVGMLGGPLAGRLLLSGPVTALRFAGGVTGGALFFFLVSNLGMWWSAYPHDGAGLVRCYLDGLPFLGRTLAADACYAGILFAGAALARRRTVRGPRPALPA